MKKRLLCILYVGILAVSSFEGSQITAKAAEFGAISGMEEESNEDYIDLEEMEEEDIETNCGDVDIIGVEDNDYGDNITEIGSTEFDDSLFEEIDEVGVETQIVVGDMAISLYPVFESREESMKNIKEVCSGILNILAEKYELPEMSEENWNSYYRYSLQYLDEVESSDELQENEEYIKLQNFFDIYENYDNNNELVQEAAKAEDIIELAESETFLLSLPYEAAEDLEESGMSISVDDKAGGMQTMNCYIGRERNIGYQMAAYNKTNATAYANTYAETPNKDRYGVVRRYHVGPVADCTNFASQILEAGGKKQNKKWYCKKQLVGFEYSPNWSAANNFANYWGVDYKYYTHSIFSQNVKKGDFITYDKAADGDWDHIGYVTAVKKSFNPKLGYKNYKVAQHTKNYNAWVSSSKNGWEKIKKENPSAKLGIIRIP